MAAFLTVGGPAGQEAEALLNRHTAMARPIRKSPKASNIFMTSQKELGIGSESRSTASSTRSSCHVVSGGSRMSTSSSQRAKRKRTIASAKSWAEHMSEL